MANAWKKVFLKIRESGLKLNKTKCQIRKQLIEFLRHIILSKGIKIGLSKSEAITKTPLPRSVNELQRFLGMVKYQGKFISSEETFIASPSIPLLYLTFSIKMLCLNYKSLN